MGKVPDKVVKELAAIGKRRLTPPELEDLIDGCKDDALKNKISVIDLMYLVQKRNNTEETLIVCCVVADYLDLPLFIEKFPEGYQTEFE